LDEGVGFTKNFCFDFDVSEDAEACVTFLSADGRLAQSSQPKDVAAVITIPKKETIAAIIVQDADLFADNAACSAPLADCSIASANRLSSAASGVFPTYDIAPPIFQIL
jgi:hypothetical protein